ncbi:succinate dehydrogenase assembly factor 2 [Bordetella genomosp. 9]|uniref:FAD assembly factor SdhE n=1 Tax=Bordetella genomosp. 9 TaxID=1416803 RepID=A0A1W6YXS8_9BORD|nr:succinate dehydrogenase assembly factor 2 [Bordetella genomosp. 9]ARP85905.1 succinate dehydrogenase assembly factor 2 [Bordetella genomosp. 9]ARP89926.1 succinate dehydrogenase assembly factor 2 [Bordetella genomosp. 9]
MNALTELERARLRWRARRGLLENDLIITKYLDAYESQLTDADVAALTQLFELGDNDLLDLLLGRSEPEGALDTPKLREIIAKMREL